MENEKKTQEVIKYMSTLKTPFRYDFVGSFLTPEKLKTAKKAFEEGTIPR